MDEKLIDNSDIIGTDVPYTDRALIQRAINQASCHDILRGKPRWFAVTRIFACGSTTATLICYKYGYDPEKKV